MVTLLAFLELFWDFCDFKYSENEMRFLPLNATLFRSFDFSAFKKFSVS